MDWLPAPGDFRADLRSALAAPDPRTRVDLLVRLSQRRLDFLQTLGLGQAVARVVAQGPTGFPSVRLAMLASSTVDHLVPGIRVAGLRWRLQIDVRLAQYGQFRQTLLDPNSTIYKSPSDFLLLGPTAREAIAGIPLTATLDVTEAAIRRAIDDLRSLWKLARERARAVIIQQTFLNVAAPLFGSYERMVSGAPATLIARMNDLLIAAATADGVLIVDVERASERDGLNAWFDETRWLREKIEIAPRMAPMYGELVTRVIAAQRGLAKKCLVLDLDNTLWGGVVGDDGLDGIVLGEGGGLGEAYLAVQRYAKQLKERGIILAVCSKNDASIAETVFNEHPEMILKRSDIAVFVANWEDKASNLVQIAERLNIGIDSLVFVDDNPAERARVRESLPMVAVPELPEDVGQYVRCLADAGYFETLTFTSEDAERGQQYIANTSREVFRNSVASLETFLKDLDMTVVARPFQSVDLQRVTQLIGKTNQFNVTTRRHPLETVSAFAAADGCLTFQFRLVDRFGDNGIVSALILRPVTDEIDALEVDTWVMSCRVFGRQLEMEALNIAVEAARLRGIRVLRGLYVPTTKNAIVRELYPSLGFEPIPSEEPIDESVRWRLQLSTYVPHGTYIARQPILI